MSQPSLPFCINSQRLRAHHTMGLIQTTNKSYWRKIGCFHVAFFVPFGILAFWGRGMCLVLK